MWYMFYRRLLKLLWAYRDWFSPKISGKISNGLYAVDSLQFPWINRNSLTLILSVRAIFLMWSAWNEFSIFLKKIDERNFEVHHFYLQYSLHLNNHFSETSISSRSSMLVGKWSDLKKEREKESRSRFSACEFSSIVGWGDQFPTWFIEAAGWAGQGRGR